MRRLTAALCLLFWFGAPAQGLAAGGCVFAEVVEPLGIVLRIRPDPEMLAMMKRAEETMRRLIEDRERREQAQLALAFAGLAVLSLIAVVVLVGVCRKRG